MWAKTLASPLNFKLVYNSKPTADDDTSIGPFGKNWRFRYESAVGRFGQEAQVINGGGRSYTFVTPNKEDLETVTHDVTLKAPDGIFDTLVYKYNAALPLQSFELTLKTSHLTYVYGTPGTVDKLGFFYLKEIKDQFGRNSTFAIDPPTGKIASISNAGRNFSFTYNDPTYSELCTGISIQGGRTLSLEYDSHKNLISIHDMMGYHGAYEYDAYGFLTLMNTAGKTNTFTYAIRPGYETDPIATQDKYLTSLTRPGSKKISYEILDEGETIKRTDAAGQISLLSNKEGQTTSITDPLGNVRKITYNGAKLPEAVTDEKGGVFTYKYDSYGNMTEKTDALGNKTTYGYDPINHSDLTSVTNALSKTWNYIYNSYFQPTQLKTPLNHITNIGYFNNNIHDITDPRGNITLFTFDPSSYGNLTSVSPSGFATSFSYDGNGFHCESITDPNGNVKSVAWDNNDRITTVNYNSVTGTPSYTNTYDAFGQINFTDELDQATSIVRDELGFVTSITDPLGYISRIEYDADNRPIKNTDPLGRASLTTYDKDGRPTVFTDAKGYKITRSYDGVGNLLSFKDKNNAETTYEYDGNNRLKKTTDPLKKVTEITRDAIGRAATSKNARGQTVTYTYDDDGHISGKTCDAPSKLSSVSYIHDANGNITKQTDAWGDTFYVYDTLNRITKITYPDSKVVDLTWKPGGQVATITYPSNNADIFVVSYTYDSFNRFPVPSVLKNNPGTELFGESRSTNAVTKVEGKINGFFFMSCAMTYNSRGQITGLTHPNTNTTYSYDKGGRLTQIQHSCTGASSNNPIAFTAKYSFDPVSNVTSETFSGSSYYQDTTLPLKMAMTYDVAGQLTGRGGKVCGNDADGNITNVGPAGEFKCTYDAENRLTKMETGSPQTTNNTYNADGLRVKKEIVGGATTVYHYLPSGVLLFTTDGSGTIMDRHVYAGSALLATNKQDGNVIHYHGDRQAHVRLITDGLGQVLVKYDYLPYSPTTGTLKTHIADTLIDGNPFTFNGILGVQDEGNGIFLMQQRFYDSASGRFFQRDPLGFAAGSNLYGFGGNNPMSNADPTGKFIDPFSLACYGLAITAVVGVGVYAVVKIKESMAGVDKAKEAEDKAFESFRKNGDTPESYAQNEKAKQARQDANDTTIDNTKKVILNSGIEAGKALVPGASTPVGNLIQNVVVDQIVDNTIKEPALNSPEPPKPQSTEGGN